MNKYEFKGTPGPWDVYQEEGAIEHVFSSDYEPVCIFEIFTGDQTAAIANAKLIAAAPEMFKLLNAAWLVISILKPTGELEKEMEALLKKITL